MMDKEIARANLKRLLQPFRSRSYAELESLVGSEVASETVKESGGKEHRLVVKVMWADWPEGHITVYGLAGKFPKTVAEAFTMSPENTITEEESH